jgi:fibronectin-binding autotransporter adhesin
MTRSRLPVVFVCAVLGLCFSTTARAQLYWDTNGATAGGSDSATAAGTWGADNFWSTSAEGTAATGAWAADELAVFSAGTNVTGTYDVALSGTQAVTGITVEEGNITFNGGTELTLVPAAAIDPDFNGDGTVDAADYVAWRKDNIGGPAGYDAWRAGFGGTGGGGTSDSTMIKIADGLTATFNSPIGGTARLVKTGDGTMSIPDLNQANTYTGGTTVSGGILEFNGEPTDQTGQPSPLGPAPDPTIEDSIILQHGATLRSTDNITEEFDFLLPSRGVTIGSGGGTFDIADPGAVLRYAGLITGSEKWTKSGPGQLRLDQASNPFTGGFRVSGGTLIHGTFENREPAPGTLRGSGAEPDEVVPDYVVLDGGTLFYDNAGLGSTFLSTRKGITLTANGGGIAAPGVLGDPTSNGAISIYFGKVTAEEGAVLYKRGHAEIRGDKASATEDEGWEQSKLVVEEGLFRVGHFAEETVFGKVPDSYVPDAIRLAGQGLTRTDGAAAIGVTSGTGALGHNAVTTTPATRGIFVEANGGTFCTSLNTNSWVIESIISGPGGLNINGNGFPVTAAGDFGTEASTLVFEGANTYEGGTTVNAGTLVARGASASLGAGNVTVDGTNFIGNLTIESGVSNAIADSATLSLTGGGAAGVADQGSIELGAGINETVAMLMLNGVGQAAGTYGATGSGATNIMDEYFAGTGILTVLSAGSGAVIGAIPEPSSLVLLAVGTLVGLTTRRRQ